MMYFCKYTDNVVEPIKIDPETQSEKSFIEYVFTHPDDHEKPKEERRQLSYAEMRMRYG